MLLEVNNLSVSYPEFTLHPVSFALDAGEMLTIVGESGSGKTTMTCALLMALKRRGYTPCAFKSLSLIHI